jgi:hypothetical protein
MKMTEVKKLTENKFPKKELLILAIIIALRAILAILIHWEIKNERQHDTKN